MPNDTGLLVPVGIQPASPFATDLGMQTRDRAGSSSAPLSKGEIDMALVEYKPGTAFPGRMGRSIGDRLTVGRDPGSPTSLLYQPPFEFTCKIFKVTTDVSGQMNQDTEEEMQAFAKAAMARK
jgi:hypothetical protein